MKIAPRSNKGGFGSKKGIGSHSVSRRRLVFWRAQKIRFITRKKWMLLGLFLPLSLPPSPSLFLSLVLQSKRRKSMKIKCPSLAAVVVVSGLLVWLLVVLAQRY